MSFEPSDFTILSQGSVSMAPGGSATSTISTEAVGGIQGLVDLSVTGVPAGASATFSPASVRAGGSSTLTIDAGGAKEGTYTLTVTGTEGGIRHSAQVPVTLAPAPANDFAIAPALDRLILVPGVPASTTITTTATRGVPGEVELSVTGVPSGATATLDRSEVPAGGAATLTVNAGIVAAGHYTITVIGTQEGADGSAAPTRATGAPSQGPLTHSTNVAASRGSGIGYHGGPVLTATKHIYYIWYGNWSGNSATTILTDFARSLGGSAYFSINTTYTQSGGARVSNSVTFSESTTDNYSRTKNLTDADVQTIVAAAQAFGRLPTDTNGVYLVLTSADVNETSGFGTQYCGWHTHGTIGGKDIKYAFVGNPDRVPQGCEAQGVGPNGNPGADGMASIIAHEIVETNTDPDLNAWYDSRGAENGDKCAWTFGVTHTAANRSLYNVTLGSRNYYLIQQNWVNAAGGYCSMHYP
jgi:hypothetical protein